MTVPDSWTLDALIEADLAMKEAALRRIADPAPEPPAIPRTRSPPRLPRHPVTMRSTDRLERPHERGPPAHLRIVPISA